MSFDFVEKFSEPQDGVYNGAYFFKVDSVAVCQPMGLEEMKGIWDSLNSFSNAKRVLEIDKYPLGLK